MDIAKSQFYRVVPRQAFSSQISRPFPSHVRCRPQSRFVFPRQQRRFQSNPADDPTFQSIVDQPPVLVRSGKKHGAGLAILAVIPITAFALGTWQIQRLRWKTDMIARYEDRLVRDPLPLPPHIDTSAVAQFDYRRVLATGRFRHDREMLVGPRVHEGEDGYLVVTPLERSSGGSGGNGGSTILVCRGWIAKKLKDQSSRPDGLPTGDITVEGLLREPPKKNMFTPANAPEKGEFYFPDVLQMAEIVGAQPVWVEETTNLELFEMMRREEKGIPIGRPPVVDLRNNHAQYIFTWYALGVVTAAMFWMVLRRKPGAGQVRRSAEW